MQEKKRAINTIWGHPVHQTYLCDSSIPCFLIAYKKSYLCKFVKLAEELVKHLDEFSSCTFRS